MRASANSALSKPRKTRLATALRCRRSYRAKATVLREAKDSSVCFAKANAPLRPPPSKLRVLCAGNLLQIIKGCSAKPARAARLGYIIYKPRCPRNSVVKCNNARSRNLMQRNVAGIWQQRHPAGQLRFKQGAQIVILSVATEGSAIEGSCRVTIGFVYGTRA